MRAVFSEEGEGIDRRGLGIDGRRFDSWLLFSLLPLAAGDRELKSQWLKH